MCILCVFVWCVCVCESTCVFAICVRVCGLYVSVSYTASFYVDSGDVNSDPYACYLGHLF